MQDCKSCITINISSCIFIMQQCAREQKISCRRYSCRTIGGSNHSKVAVTSCPSLYQYAVRHNHIVHNLQSIKICTTSTLSICTHYTNLNSIKIEPSAYQLYQNMHKPHFPLCVHHTLGNLFPCGQMKLVCFDCKRFNWSSTRAAIN